jgi:pyrroline-5-carboxylate reductase
MDSQPPAGSARLGFIGAGKLAGSLIRGLIRSGKYSAESIIAGEPNESARAALQRETGMRVTPNNLDVVTAADVLFVGVKPAIVLPALKEIHHHTGNKLIISLAAGVRIESMESVTNGRVMRAMTNTPSAICRAATALACGSRTTAKDIEVAKEVFGAVGLAVEVPEGQIDAVTALSGSGPAFVYSVIEALAKGGEKTGLAPEVALALATQTVLGAAQLATETKLSPDELRKMVVTPGGTTAAGLAAMAKHGTSEGLGAAVEAAAKRGAEMASENK